MLKRIWCAITNHSMTSECYAIQGDETSLVVESWCQRCGIHFQMKLLIADAQITIEIEDEV